MSLIAQDRFMVLAQLRGDSTRCGDRAYDQACLFLALEAVKIDRYFYERRTGQCRKAVRINVSHQLIEFDREFDREFNGESAHLAYLGHSKNLGPVGGPKNPGRELDAIYSPGPRVTGAKLSYFSRGESLTSFLQEARHAAQCRHCPDFKARAKPYKPCRSAIFWMDLSPDVGN